jgi:hypothetical protein
VTALLTIITSFLVSIITVLLREALSSKREAKTREEVRKNHLLSKLEALADSLSLLPSALEELHIERIKTMGNGVPPQDRLNAIEAKCNGLITLYFDDDLGSYWKDAAAKCNVACNKSVEFMIANLSLIGDSKPPLMPGSAQGEAFKSAMNNFLSAFNSMLTQMPNVRRSIENGRRQ